MTKNKWKAMTFRTRFLWIMGFIILVSSLLLTFVFLTINTAYEKYDLLKNTGWVHVYFPQRTEQPNIIDFDSTGQAWIGTDSGLYVASPTGEIEPQRIFSGHPVYIMTIDRQDRIWIPYGRKITVIDAINREPLSSPIPYPPEKVGRITFDQLGRIWTASTTGIHIFTEDSWVELNPDNSPLSSNNIRAIKFDQQGRAWIGTSNGLQVFSGQDLYDPANWKTYNLGDFEDIIRIILIDSEDNVWVGTEYSGVGVYDGVKWTYFPNPDESISHNSRYVMSMASDSKGRIYALFYSSLMIIDDREVYIYDDDNSGFNSLAKNVSIDPDGNPWFSTSWGILIAEVDESGLPSRIPEGDIKRGVDEVDFALLSLLEIATFVIFILIIVWLMVFAQVSYVPVSSLAIGCFITVLLLLIGNSLKSSLGVSITMSVCSLLGGLLSALIRKYLIDLKIISYLLIPIGAVIGFIVYALVFVGSG